MPTLENTIEIPAGKAIGGIKLIVKVTGLIKFKIRLWIGSQVIKLGCLIIGCGVSIDTEVQ